MVSSIYSQNNGDNQIFCTPFGTKRCFIPLPFSFALEFTVWKIQENQEGSALNATYQHLVFVDEIDVLARTQIP
jgi:hypothetical protein